MNKKKILVVDDEPYIREFLAQLLSEDHQVILANDGDEGIKCAGTIKPDLIILDVVMPGKNGIQVCKILRMDPVTKLIPILMLTAVNQVEHRTAAFEAGADDYFVKPFDTEELLARVHSKLRRLDERPIAVTNVINFGDMILDFQQLKAEISGTKIDFGQIEFKILNCLIKNQGQLVEREVLNEFVWGAESPAERALDPHITALRKKIKFSQSELKTIYGRGYSLVLREKDS
jgi:DNA-binding response OmpR family regulator